MNLVRFQELADAYGDLMRWPEDLREEGRRLAEASPDARVILADARRLDALLARVDPAQDAPAADAATIAAASILRQETLRSAFGLRRLCTMAGDVARSRAGWPAALLAASVAGFLVGRTPLVQPPSDEFQSELTLVDPGHPAFDAMLEADDGENYP